MLSMNPIFPPEEPNLVIFKMLSHQITKQYRVSKMCHAQGSVLAAQRDSLCFQKLAVLNFIVYFQIFENSFNFFSYLGLFFFCSNKEQRPTK